MKHFIKLLACLLLTGLLAACGIPDGVYTARFESFDSLGYRDYLTVTMEGGAIVAAVFDAEDALGGKKSADAAYAQRMQPLTGITPSQISTHFTQLLTNAKKPGKVKIDALAGATVSVQKFEHFWAQLRRQLKTGETQPLIIKDEPELLPSSSGSSE